MRTNFNNWILEYVGGRVTKVYPPEEQDENRPVLEQQQAEVREPDEIEPTR